MTIPSTTITLQQRAAAIAIEDFLDPVRRKEISDKLIAEVGLGAALQVSKLAWARFGPDVVEWGSTGTLYLGVRHLATFENPRWDPANGGNVRIDGVTVACGLPVPSVYGATGTFEPPFGPEPESITCYACRATMEETD